MPHSEHSNDSILHSYVNGVLLLGSFAFIVMGKGLARGSTVTV